MDSRIGSEGIPRTQGLIAILNFMPALHRQYGDQQLGAVWNPSDSFDNGPFCGRKLEVPMSSERKSKSSDEIEKLYRSFKKRGWLDSASKHQLRRNREDFLELTTMLQNAALLVAQSFGGSEAEKNEIFFKSRFGQFLSDLRDELHNLAGSVKSEKLQPVESAKPRNTSHSAKNALNLIVLNACAVLIPYHNSKVACFREVSKLLKKHDTYLKAETIAKIWYARVKKNRMGATLEGSPLYADTFIASGGQLTPGDDQPTHRETIEKVISIMRDVLPDIPPDLRNAA